MRIMGWEGELARYIEQARNLSFEWGRNDCALWAARWVRLCTGDDFLHDWEGRYEDKAGAYRLMRERGFGGVSDIADQHLEIRPVLLARRGDLVLHPQACLGICNSLRSHFLMVEGEASIPTLDCLRAWGVG